MSQAVSPSLHTTRWTLVQRSRGSDTEAQQALSDLCGIYYPAVVAFIGRIGFEESRARDLAHDFFARLLVSADTMNPNPERGRFRSYLLGAVKHFVSDALDRERAKKRGSGTDLLELDDSILGEDPGLAADRAFDRQWALTLIDRVLDGLAAEFDAGGKSQHFTILKPWLTGDEGEMTQAETARQLGMNEGALKVAIHRLRKRFRELVKQEVSQTVTDASEVKDELAHLLAAL